MVETELKNEVWVNNTLSTLGVLKYNRRGEPIHEIVYGHGKFSISVEERLMNQDRSAAGLDVFTNGTLSPVRLVEGSEGAAEIAANPNLMGETEIKGLFKLSLKALQAKVDEVTNPITLTRMLAVAEEADATVRQVRTVQERLDAVAPKTYSEHSAPAPRTTGMNPVQVK